MTSEMEHSLASFSALVDERVGLIRKLEFVALTERDPRVYLAHAEPADTRPLTGMAAANRGAACAWTADRAALRACGEALERYCSAVFDLSSILLASEADLLGQGAAHIRTAELYPFSDAQYAEPGFPFRRPSSEQALRWCVGQDHQGAKTLVPASCVYVPYLFDEAVEPFTHMPISTGLAAGRSIADCVDKGVCEILERDALMIVWLNRKAMPRIRTDSCRGFSAELDGLLTAGETPGTRWHINLLSLDVDVPVISAALIDDADPPLTSFGISADLEPSKALRGALEEALLTRLLVNRSRIVAPGVEDGSGGQDVRTLRDHLLAHAASPELRAGMRFLTDDGPEIDFSSLHGVVQDGDTATDRCVAAGLRPVWIDVTTPDVDDLGFKVVRTVIPNTQPLDNDHQYRHLGGARIATVPAALNWGVLECPNPQPHPFP